MASNSTSQRIVKRAITQTNMRVISQNYKQSFFESEIQFQVLGNSTSVYDIKFEFQNKYLFSNLVKNIPNNPDYPILTYDDIIDEDGEKLDEYNIRVRSEEEIQNFIDKHPDPNCNMSCNCPFYTEKNQVCKHISLVFLKIFRLIPDMMMTSLKLSGFQQQMLWNLYKKYRKEHNLPFTPKKSLYETANNSNSNTNDLMLDGSNYTRLKCGDNCPVCFETMQTSERLFQCQQCQNHIHMSCMEEVVKYNTSCPLCRYHVEIRKTEEKITDIFSQSYPGDVLVFSRSLNILSMFSSQGGLTFSS